MHALATLIGSVLAFVGGLFGHVTPVAPMPTTSENTAAIKQAATDALNQGPVVGSTVPQAATDALNQGPVVGSTVPKATDFYTDSLVAGITKTATTMTLVSGLDSQGVSLSGTYGFVLDQGTASQEIVVCSASGTALTSCVRGIDLTTGTTSISALEQTHNRGATVQITTGPVVNIIDNIIRGVESLPGATPLYYDSHPCSVSASAFAVCDKNYIDNQVVAGGVPGSNTVAGIYILASPLQIASTTATSSYNSVTYNNVIGSGQSTSSPQDSGLGKGYVPATQNDGKLSPNFLDGASDNYTFNGTTTMASSTIYVLNVPMITATSTTATSTFAGGVNLTKSGTGIQFSDGTIQTTKAASIAVPVNDGTAYITSGTATSTITYTIPAGTLSANSSIDIINQYGLSSGFSVTNDYRVRIGNGSASTTLYDVDTNNGHRTVSATVSNANSLSSQNTFTVSSIDGTPNAMVTGTAAINTANQWYVSVEFSTSNMSDPFASIFTRIVSYK